MSSFVYLASDEQATEVLGRKLAELLPEGAVIALCGPLGAGKTRLVQAVAEASGIDRHVVTSPTFVLVHEYQGCRPIFHFDAYRVKDDDEFLALAPFEYFESAGLSLVEWADRVRDCLPREYLEVTIEPTGPQSRKFTFASRGDLMKPVIVALASWHRDSNFLSEPGT